MSKIKGSKSEQKSLIFMRCLNYAEVSSKEWVTLGQASRRVHEVEVPSAIKNEIRKETFSPKWRERAYRLFEGEFPKGLDEVSEKFRELLENEKETIQRLVKWADELSLIAKNESVPFVLCHSDIHGGNVLIEKGGSLYIVDWDEPILAPKERDLMFIGGGVANVWNKPKEEELFYEGYGAPLTNQALLSYYRHERIVEDIVLYAQDILFTSHEITKKETMLTHFKAMFEPNGVVDIAFGGD